MKEVVIVSAVRTPIGNFNGSLSAFSPVELGTIAVKEALKRANLNGEEIDEVFMGCILQTAHGQGIARQISVNSGIPVETPATTINMLCGSGLKAVSWGVQSILLGDNDVVVVGGAESMSQAAFALPKARWGYKMGHGELSDTMIKDALTDAFNEYHMGVTAENIAEKWGISREEQDEFAYASQMKATRARVEGKFNDEIVPVEIPQRKGEPIIFDQDEYIKESVTLEKMTKLKPAFKKDGTVTAANASGINDGASALVIMTKEKADELGIKPIARVASYASAGVEPSIMGYGPVPASKKALDKAGLTIEDIDLVEANEAFAAQSIAVVRDLGVEPEKVNVNGGAIALGHPVGASGARILVTLLHEMIKRDSKYGLATLCIGGGMGEAVVVERS